MKKINTYITIILAGSLCFCSCKKYINEDINKRPENPEDVSMNVILPGTQASLAFSYGSDLSRFPSLWIQTLSGLANQHLIFDNYNLIESDVNNMWYFNLYGGAMSDLNILIKKANENNSPHYGGVAKILMANALGTCTALWGDVPYSEAFQKLDNLKPKYDSQQQIYDSIQSLLDQGISDLEAASSLFTPGGDELIYGGDLAKWKKFAHGLKARYYLHLSKRDASNYTKALTEISNALTSNSENAVFLFGQKVNESNPYYQFFSVGRPGDAGVGAKIVDIMNSLNDPRRAVYFTPDGECNPDTCYSGSAAGAGNSKTSKLGPYYNSPASPVFFITYAEVLFIKAECAFRTGDNATAASAYNEAIAASLNQYGVTDAEYLTANANENAGSITLEKIFIQKYIHMFCQGTEGFTDWRRSIDATHPNGIPELLPAEKNTTGGIIPRRFPYPSSERLQNGANLMEAVGRQGGARLTDRVWWDIP